MAASKGRGGKTGGGDASGTTGGDGDGDGDGGGTSSLKQPECCMCGDYGLSEMLFKCKICKFRLQHKYCSNEYPKSESYKACNWCLTNSAVNDRHDDAIKNKISLRERKRASEIKVTPIMKLVGPEESTGRKRGVAVEKKNHVVLRKSKSANFLSNGGGTGIGMKTRRPVFRNKVRRYKSLEEVSSQ